jgi:hypothetical protein
VRAAGRLPGFVLELVEQWRTDAALLRRRGAPDQADTMESLAAELEQRAREHQLEALALEQATAESGYSYSAISKMVAKGELANVGKKGAPRVRRGDLPRKVRREERAPTEGIAAVVLESRATAPRAASRCRR